MRADIDGMMGNKALYRRLLVMFRERERRFDQRFRRAREAGDIAACTRCAHDLKSVSGTLGMPSLQRAAAALEAACEANATADEIDGLLDTVLGLLEPILLTLDAVGPSPAVATSSA